MVVGQIQLGDISDVFKLSGNLFQLQPRQDQPLDRKALIDASQPGHAGTRDAGVLALASFGADVRG